MREIDPAAIRQALSRRLEYAAMPRRRRYPLHPHGVRMVHSITEVSGDHCVLLVQSAEELDAALAVVPEINARRIWGLCAPFIIRSPILPAVHSRFERVVYFDSPGHISQARRRAIERCDASVALGSLFDPATGMIILMRCDLSCAVVPPQISNRIWNCNGRRPELSDDGALLNVGGRTICVVDVLAAVDPVFRREHRRRLWAQRGDLGSRVRHLRKLRRARREDFPGVTAKTVARIERGEIKMPQKETLRLIAHHLGVDPAELLNGLSTS